MQSIKNKQISLLVLQMHKLTNFLIIISNMRVIKLVMIFAFPLMFLSCIKEDKTLSHAFIYNGSNVGIQITLFSSGVPMLNYQLDIEPNDSLVVSTDSYIGKGKMQGAGFNNKYFELADSLIVIFDDSFKVTHYRDTPLVFANKYYLPSNPLCIMNIGNWEYSFDETKHSITNYFTYTFTEADYEYAKQ